MNISIQHKQTKEEAKRRMEVLIQRLKKEYGGQLQNFKEEWSDYTNKVEGSAKGYSVSGMIDVKDGVVTVDLKLPFLLKVFSSKIKSVVEEQIKKELDDSHV